MEKWRVIHKKTHKQKWSKHTLLETATFLHHVRRDNLIRSKLLVRANPPPVPKASPFPTHRLSAYLAKSRARTRTGAEGMPPGANRPQTNEPQHQQRDGRARIFILIFQKYVRPKMHEERTKDSRNTRLGGPPGGGAQSSETTSKTLSCSTHRTTQPRFTLSV